MPHHWKKHLAPHHDHRGIAIIAPGEDAKQIRLLLVTSIGKSAVIVAPAAAHDELRKAIAESPFIVDLVALGTGPTPPPGPGPGPVGDDTIVAAALQVTAAIQVLSQLVAMRPQQ